MLHDARPPLSAFFETLRARARDFGSAPLLALPDGSVADLKTGYIPLLVHFSEEDKAAKGLRKLKEHQEVEPAVYFSALEMVREHRSLLLLGETGSGKTTFARHLAYRLATGRMEVASLPRNDFGAVREERWDTTNILPVYIPVTAEQGLTRQLASHYPELETTLADTAWQESDETLLVILDGVEVAAPSLLYEAANLQARYPRIRVLALGERSEVKGWLLSTDWTRIELLPLLEIQRHEAVKRLAPHGSDVTVAQGDAAANPAQFAMALSSGVAGTSMEEIADAWTNRIAGDPSTASFLCGLAFDALSGKLNDPTVLPVRRVRQMLAARHLADQPASLAVGVFRKDAALWAPVLRSLARRVAGTPRAATLIETLLSSKGQTPLRGALLAAELIDENDSQIPELRRLLLQIIEEGALSMVERERAGRHLSRLGDPRDLTALADVPGGAFTFGSEAHSNSEPSHLLEVKPFRIGVYPVVNDSYGRFIQETGRLWRSPDGFDPERRNAPATDLTWRDANVYCAWLTKKWRAEGRITEDDVVRLPTEPEWERAARGAQSDAGHAEVYPWGLGWQDDASNSEEAGFNNTCTVGLFPKGRSPYGCYDMVGQVWEWCTTLWGEDMASPSFRYPYSDDGRENPEAGPGIRRVLRGGCFSSGKLKANCTYRGSLEPDGFWRGNGFRIVVAKAN
ncbi:formylglycine-generating enzyme family protein [Rhizobium oryzicola]|uniref:SUMF1/EgtB/PvdO family nonheme iron enzyme n=1 Tax=Rhizobium oryzicola TaxID=1232668 RepID=A0ABT8T3M9_9HYPH|nr:SUMF1/EgtB/PvdO family nonheme iron enzyme [Rhizobium oryzicola]MDO1585354.1 SUMF1/EgtB/PvdO family nonheme iron enzyme [Rhizobium oryzicola]